MVKLHKRQTCIIALISLLLILASLIGACSQSGTPATSNSSATVNQPVIRLTASCYLPPAHMLAIMMGDMMKEIEELSNGRIQITYQAGGSILTAPKPMVLNRDLQTLDYPISATHPVASLSLKLLTSRLAILPVG